MRKEIARGAAALAAVAGLVVVAVTPASAADTATTFTLEGGLISVTAEDTAELPGANSGTTTVSGQLGTVRVTDNRGGQVGWSAKVTTTTFTDGVTTASLVRYNSGVVTPGGTVTATGRGTITLSSTPAEVVAGSVVVGNNTATWNPTLTVTLPASSTAGEYSATITHSVS